MEKNSSNAITRVGELAGRLPAPVMETCHADVIGKGFHHCAPAHSPENALIERFGADFVRRLIDDGRIDMREAPSTRAGQCGSSVRCEAGTCSVIR